MKKITFLILLIAGSQKLSAQFKPVEAQSSLQFTIQNLGFDVNGKFSGFAGAIDFDPQNPAAGKFDVTVDAATVNTGNNLRDSHLKEDGYFDVKNYPLIRIVSQKITAGSKAGAFIASAKLTIKGRSQDISIPFTAAPDNGGYLFKGSFRIKRKDFDVGGTSTVSNELQVQLSVTAKKE